MTTQMCRFTAERLHFLRQLESLCPPQIPTQTIKKMSKAEESIHHFNLLLLMLPTCSVSTTTAHSANVPPVGLAFSDSCLHQPFPATVHVPYCYYVPC